MKITYKDLNYHGAVLKKLAESDKITDWKVSVEIAKNHGEMLELSQYYASGIKAIKKSRANAIQKIENDNPNYASILSGIEAEHAEKADELDNQTVNWKPYKISVKKFIDMNNSEELVLSAKEKHSLSKLEIINI